MKMLFKVIALLVLVIAIPLVYLLLNPLTKKEDELGRIPSDVVKLFLTEVQKRNFEGALKYWHADAVENIRHNSGLTFTDYCMKHFYCTSFEISEEYTGKTDWVLVEFVGHANQENRGRPIALRLIDGHWALMQGRY